MVNYNEKLFLSSFCIVLYTLYELLLFSESSESSNMSCFSVIAVLYSSAKVELLVIGLANALARMTIEVGLPDSYLNKS